MGRHATMLKEPHALIWDHRLREDDQKLVAELNTTLQNLSGLRAIEITVSGPFARSKIAGNWLLISKSFSIELSHWLMARQQHGIAVVPSVRSCQPELSWRHLQSSPK
jgi:hypothetical protein